MFSKTRNKLTLFFSSLIMIVLISFNVISYFLLSSILYGEREKELQILASMEAEEHSDDLIKQSKEEQEMDDQLREEEDQEMDEQPREEEDGNVPPESNRWYSEKKTLLRPFYYVLDERGNWVSGEELYPELREEIVEQLVNWQPKSGEVISLSFDEDGHKDIHLIFAGRRIYLGDVYYGSVYTGADISQQSEVFKQFMIILAVLSALFLIISVFIGYVMSGKVMVPIIRSFARQQQFVADASHELRTPLSVIQSSLEVIEAEEQEHMHPFSKQVLEDLKNEVKRMSNLVAQMLTLARTDSTEIQLIYETFSLNAELERLIRTFQPMANHKRQMLSLEVAPEIKIWADRERIVQLIMILVDNAIQYTGEMGRITVTANVQGKKLQLSVADTGIGIAKEKQKDIFDRFYRVDSSRSRTHGNAGLGLSIAKWIVDTHGGTIRVESEPGKGSRFVVLLPLSNEG